MSVRALIGALGKAGTGKSSKLRALARPCRRLLVADADGGWPLERGDVLVEGAPALFRAMRQATAANPSGPFRIVYRDEADRMAWAAPLAAFAARDATLLIDELAWLCTPSYAPPPLKQTVQFGRIRRINILYTTREPQEIHNIFLSQANRLYFFRIEPGNGLTRVKRDWPQYVARLPQLREFPGPRAPAESIAHGDARIERLLGREGLDNFRSGSLPSRRTCKP